MFEFYFQGKKKKKGKTNLLEALIPWFTTNSRMASYSYTYGQLETFEEKRD